MTAPTASAWVTDPDGDPTNDTPDVDVLTLEGTPADILVDDPDTEAAYGDDVDRLVDGLPPRVLATVTESGRPGWTHHPRRAARAAGGWLVWAVTRWWWANARHSWRAARPAGAMVGRFVADTHNRHQLAAARQRYKAGQDGAIEVRRARRSVRWGMAWRWPLTGAVGYLVWTWVPGLGPLGLVALATVAFLATPVVGVAAAPDPTARTLFRRRTTTVHQEVPRADRIVFALANLGIKTLADPIAADPEHAVQFLGDIHPNKAKTGHEVTVILPGGTPAALVIRQLLRFAGLINYNQATVFLEQVEDAPPTWLRIVMLDEPIGRRKARRWRYLDGGHTDFFRPMEVGEDQHGNPVSILLDEASILVGAIPGAGKTWAGRVIAAAAALDPRVMLYVANFKGGAGWRAAKPVCHFYRSSGDVGSIIRDVYKALKPLQAEITRRGQLIEEAFDRFLSSKLTPAMADDVTLGLAPIVIVIDEYHFAFSHPLHGKRLRVLVEDLIRRGREYGIVIILLTQKPSSRTTPTDLRDNMSLRIAMKLMAQSAHDMILGSGAWKNGWRTHQFPRRARGLALIVGEDDHPITCQFPNVDDQEIAQVFQRALARRAATGRLTGEALGDVLVEDETGPASNPTTVDLLQVWPSEPDPEAAVRADGLVQRVTTATLVERLATLDEDRYGGWTPGMLTEDLAEFRWPIIDVDTGHQAVDGEGRPKWRGLTDPKHVTGIGTQRAIDVDELLRVNADHLAELDAIAEAERALAMAAAGLDDDDEAEPEAVEPDDVDGWDDDDPE